MARHVFISYAHEDVSLAEAVTLALHRSKIAIPFIDKIALGPGDSLTQKLGDGLDNAKALVILVSRSSAKSNWVRNELKAILHREIPIIPIRCDESEWPSQLLLLLGDRIHLDAFQDTQYAVGAIPKLFAVDQSRNSGTGFGDFFSLKGCESKAPHAQVFAGTLESFWDEHRFGRTAVVLPTNQSVNLSGRVTSAFLAHVGIDPGKVSSSVSSITSSQVAELQVASIAPEGLVLFASTAFNVNSAPEARDQWASASAVLEAAQCQKCSVVLVPPIGSGSFDWPVRQAVVNWIYGAIRWAYRNPTATELSTWPIVCVPGPGDQTVLKGYLGSLTGVRRETLMRRELGIKIRHEGEETEEVAVSDDLLLGAVAKNAIRTLEKNSAWRFRHGKQLCRKSTHEVFEYGPSTPLARTIFADGDTIELL